MITVHHARGCNPWINCNCVYQNGLQIYGTCNAQCYVPGKYLMGMTEPNFPVPTVQYDVLLRPMGIAITRDWDGLEGDRFTLERTWFKRELNLN